MVHLLHPDRPSMIRVGHAVLIACVLMTICCGPAASEALKAKSDVKGISLVALATLPRSPETGSPDAICPNYRAKTLTDAGKSVVRLGWIVTSDAPLGRYEAVTFVSGFTPGTSGLCFARNANVGIFSGNRLVALAYASRSEDGPLGTVEPLEGGGLLVWTDPPGTPVGELHQTRSGLRLTDVASERTFCSRRAVVPNIYGKPIVAARRVLIAGGWRPQRPSEKPTQFDLANDLAKRGVVEAEACSGTGVGYCAFAYRGPAGVLGVTTAGDDNHVVYYEVACAKVRAEVARSSHG